MDQAVVRPEFEPAEFIMGGNVTAETVCANIRENAGRELPALGFRKVCVCGNGPSLGDHIEELRQRKAAGWDIAAMNGSYNFLLAHRIIPTWFFMVDARKEMNRKFVTTPSMATRHVIASQCDPEIFEMLRGYNVALWHVFNYPGAIEALHETAKPGSVYFSGAANVGHSCLNPLVALGYRDFALFGYDSSVRGEAKHALKQDNDADEPIVSFGFPLNEDGSSRPETKVYRSTPTMAHAASLLPDRIADLRAKGIRVELKGDGLAQAMVNQLAPAWTAGQVSTAEEAKPLPVPPAIARRKGRDTAGALPIVTFKWRGHIPYSAEDVRIWASQVARHMSEPHELVVITDEADGLNEALWPVFHENSAVRSVRILPMWRDHFEHGRDWHRLKLFAPEMADIIGPRFAVMDLDTVICGDLAPLFDTDAPYKAWRDPNRDQYCTALQLTDAGAFPHVWDSFDRNFALELRKRGLFGGYDQAWISHALPGMPRWDAGDGVLSFKKDILGGSDYRAAKHTGLYRGEMRTDADLHISPPAGARVINFHGEHKPRDADVQAAFPWIAKHYR